MPPPRKSPPRKRRNLHLLSIPDAPARRNQTQGNLLPRQLLLANPAANHPGHLQISRRMVRLPRRKIDRHLSSRLPAAQPPSQKRSLERPAKSNGISRPATQKTLTPRAVSSACLPPGRRPAGSVVVAFDFDFVFDSVAAACFSRRALLTSLC